MHIECSIHPVLLLVQPLHFWYCTHYQHVQSVDLALGMANSLTFPQAYVQEYYIGDTLYVYSSISLDMILRIISLVVSAATSRTPCSAE